MPLLLYDVNSQNWHHIASVVPSEPIPSTDADGKASRRQESEEWGNEVIARLNPRTDEIENFTGPCRSCANADRKPHLRTGTETHVSLDIVLAWESSLRATMKVRVAIGGNSAAAPPSQEGCHECHDTDADCPAPWDRCAEPVYRSCFPDPIRLTGLPAPPRDGVAHPTLVGAFCMASARNPSVDLVAGYPGPTTFVWPAEVVFDR